MDRQSGNAVGDITVEKFMGNLPNSCECVGMTENNGSESERTSEYRIFFSVEGVEVDVCFVSV